MKKRSHKNRLHWNLENCRYVRFWHRPPPLTAWQSNALAVLPTAKNSRTVSSSSSDPQHCSIALPCHQGHSRNHRFRWLDFTSGLESKNSQRLSPFAVAGLSAVRDRSAAATCRAYSRSLRAARLC